MTEQKKQEPQRWITERTENIIGAVVIMALVGGVLATLGWAVPNYYVYFKNTVAMVGTCKQ